MQIMFSRFSLLFGTLQIQFDLIGSKPHFCLKISHSQVKLLILHETQFLISLPYILIREKKKSNWIGFLAKILYISRLIESIYYAQVVHLNSKVLHTQTTRIMMTLFQLCQQFLSKINWRNFIDSHYPTIPKYPQCCHIIDNGHKLCQESNLNLIKLTLITWDHHAVVPMSICLILGLLFYFTNLMFEMIDQ